ncbi:MAG: PKD domain-containing protein [Bacteroidetes bacterium]|nr:MAG: PKD domain-containing protein [Bacteroidota bacterium]
MYRLLVQPRSDCYQPLITEEVTVAEFALPEAAPSFSRNGNTVTFSSNAMATENYFWFFGAGASSMEANPSFTFPGEGVYPVNLTVTNDCGSQTYTLEVRINPPVVARASATVRRGCAPLVVRFTDSSSGPVVDRRWTFPGGMPATSTESNPQVVFSEVGSYMVSLRVSNEEMSSELTIPIEVIATPRGDFTWEANDNEVQFRNTSENLYTYIWDFGDGDTSTEPNPLHVYDRPGSYEVTLNTSNGSCAVASSQTVSLLFTTTEEALWEQTISLYPNPAHGQVNLRGAAGSRATLCNLQGQRLQQWLISTDVATLSLPAGPPGTLVLLVEKEGQLRVFRLVSLP